MAGALHLSLDCLQFWAKGNYDFFAKDLAFILSGVISTAGKRERVILKTGEHAFQAPRKTSSLYNPGLLRRKECLRKSNFVVVKTASSLHEAIRDSARSLGS